MKHEQLQLVDLPPMPARLKIRNIKKPIWSKNKAKLIERYVYYFLQVTKNCKYIDGFAGPQREENSKIDDEMWSARLVTQLRPRWISRLYLFDHSVAQVRRIRRMVASQPPREPKEPNRQILITRGDTNVELPRLLAKRPFTEKSAVFCLLDQRTFDCHWSTVEAVARYKRDGMKIEILYFFPIGWLDRSLEALRNERKGELWWGRPDWKSLRKTPSAITRGEIVAERFKKELGYRHAFPWPIFEKPGSQRKLMWRAYHKAVEPIEDGSCTSWFTRPTTTKHRRRQTDGLR